MASAAEDDAAEEAVLPDGDRQRGHRLFIVFGSVSGRAEFQPETDPRTGFGPPD